ncbi:MAG: hypothetical protein R3B68_13010 [Phycisphaerales bacterium]
MNAQTITATLAASTSKYATLGFNAGAVRVARESVKPSAEAGTLTATLVQPYGSAEPETQIVFDPAQVAFIKF